MLTTEQQAIIDKLKVMNSLPGTIAWGTEADVGAMAGGFSGSRTQEAAARNAYAIFISMGGQAELDRLRLAVLTDPVLNAEWAAVIAAGNRGDWFSAIGNTIVSLTPTALKVAAVVAGADIIMGGTLITATAAPAVATSGAATIPTATTTAAATVSDVAAAQGTITQMTGAGISDAVIAQSATQAATSYGVAGSQAAIAEMSAASWGTLSTGITVPVIPSLPDINPPSAPSTLSTPSTPSTPSAPSVPSIPPSAPSVPGYSTITDSLIQVAPKAFDVAAQVAMASLAPKKTAQSSPATAPEMPVYDNTSLYLIGGIAAAIIAVVLIK